MSWKIYVGVLGIVTLIILLRAYYKYQKYKDIINPILDSKVREIKNQLNGLEVKE